MARETFYGIFPNVRIKVKGSDIRKADHGTVVRPITTLNDRKMVEYRSDRNGGIYMVAVDRVSVVRREEARPMISIAPSTRRARA